MNKISTPGFPRVLYRLILTMLLVGICQGVTYGVSDRQKEKEHPDIGRVQILPSAQSNIAKAAAYDNGIAIVFPCNQLDTDSYTNYQGSYLGDYAWYWMNPNVSVNETGQIVLKYGQYSYFMFERSSNAPALEAIKILLDPNAMNNATIGALSIDMETGDEFYVDNEIITDYANNAIYWMPSERYDLNNITFHIETGEISMIGFEIYSEGNTPADFMSGSSFETVPAPVFNPTSCSFNSPISVEISAEEGCEIYYTANGNDPELTEQNKYKGPIVISATTTFKAVAVDEAGNMSRVVTSIYTCTRHGIGDGYDPDSPGNPGADAYGKKYHLTVVTNPTSGGSSYANSSELEAGQTTYVYTYSSSGFEFINWTIEGEEVSNTTSFYYAMPEHDVTLVANYRYNPQSPGNPNPNEQKVKHPVVIRSVPSGIASFSPSGSFDMEENTSRTIYAYPNSDWELTGWSINGEDQYSTSTNINIEMKQRALDIVAYFTYNPTSPANPGANYFNPATGQVIVDDFTPGGLYNAINAITNGSWESISHLIVKGVMNSSDMGVFYYMPYASIVDLARTNGVESIGSYAFENMYASVIMLPSGIKSISNYAFYGCKNLTSLICYALEPPVCSNNTFTNFTNKENCIVYVPEQSVELYQNAAGWMDFEIRPIVSEANILDIIPEDLEGWNDLSRPHRIAIKGEYESSLGEEGKIEYSVDNSEWITLIDRLQNGESFTSTLVAIFNQSMAEHTIQLRTVDVSGNVTMLDPLVYKDVSYLDIQGKEDKIYDWGEPVIQTSISCELEDGQYAISNYRNNRNAGVASFDIEGVYPYSIGRGTYKFNINPLPLSGEIEFTEDVTYKYTGNPHTPEWRFTDERYNSLIEGYDYKVDWKDNLYPGTATLHVQGINNFTDSLQNTFIIERGPLLEEAYSVKLPKEDITFDGKSHSASGSRSFGVGEMTFYYALNGSDELSEEAPVEPGEYDVYLEIAEGLLYFGLPLTKQGSFAIYKMDELEWESLQEIALDLTPRGWLKPWDVEAGITAVSSFEGLTIEKGHVTGIDLSNQNLSGLFPITVSGFLPELKELNLSHNDLIGSFDELISQVSASTAECFKNISKVDISYNGFEGNVGAFAELFPALASLNASHNRITEVSPMISTKVTNLQIGSQELDGVIIDLDLTNFNIDEFNQSIPTVLTYDHQDRNYDRTLLLECRADESWIVEIVYNKQSVYFRTLTDKFEYHGKSGDILSICAYSNVGIPLADMQMRLSFNVGDSNFDADVSVIDLESTFLYIFDAYSKSKPFNFTAADTYPDERINVQDMICTANLLLSNNNSEDGMQKAPGTYSTDSEADAYVYVANNTLYLNSSRPVAALDILIDGDAEWKLNKYGFDEASNDNHIVGYSLSGITLPCGIVEIATVPEGTRILKCVLSDEEANTISVCKNNVQTGVEMINGSDEDDQMIYDLSGRRMNSMMNGVNIKVDRNGVQKILKSK